MCIKIKQKNPFGHISTYNFFMHILIYYINYGIITYNLYSNDEKCF